MRYFDKQLIANSRDHARWYGDLWADRQAFHNQENQLAAMQNQSAILPQDAWREVDAMTKRIMVGDEGRPWMTDLMPLAKTVPIGKIVHTSRVSSDISDEVIVDFGGQEAVPVDKSTYDYRNTPIPIFRKGYGREWREWNALQSENFDALADDQDATLRKVMRRNALYVLDGAPTMSVGGATAYGIRTSPLSKAINLGSGAGGANIDLTASATTADAIDAFFTGVVGKVLDDNFIAQGANIYISPEIARNFDRSYSGSGGFKGGTLRDYLLTNRRINKIEVSFELSGNEFFGFVPDSQYIRPLIGMATSTFAMPRLYPTANYHFMVWNAMGIEIRADADEHTGVFYSVVVN